MASPRRRPATQLNPERRRLRCHAGRRLRGRRRESMRSCQGAAEGRRPADEPRDGALHGRAGASPRRTAAASRRASTFARAVALFLGASLLDSDAEGSRSAAHQAPSPPCRRTPRRGRCWHGRSCPSATSQFTNRQHYRTLTRARWPESEGVVRTRSKLRGHQRGGVRCAAAAGSGFAAARADRCGRRGRQERSSGRARDLSPRDRRHAAGRRAARSGRRDLRACRESPNGPRRSSESAATHPAECATGGRVRLPRRQVSRGALAARVKSPVGLYWTIRAANRLATEAVARSRRCRRPSNCT